MYADLFNETCDTSSCFLINLCVHAKSLQSCLLCDPLNCSLPGSSVHGIVQERILEWVATPSSKGALPPGMNLRLFMSPALAGRFLLELH